MKIIISLIALMIMADATFSVPTTHPPPAQKEDVSEVPKQDDQVPTREGRNIDNDLNKGSLSSIEEALLRKLNLKCTQKEVSSCVMLKLVTYMNRLLKKSTLEISESVEITQTSPVVQEDIKVEEIHDDETSRKYKDESLFSEIISEKLWNFVKSRSLKWKLFPEADVVLSASDDNGNLGLGVAVRSTRSIEEGRGKMKNMGPIIAAGIMKFGMLKVLAFKALALLVGKALLLSKLAFLLASIIGLKKLFSHQKHVTYEVVAHPHHSHSAVESHGHPESYSSGWGRSGDAQNLAYRAHVKK